MRTDRAHRPRQVARPVPPEGPWAGGLRAPPQNSSRWRAQPARPGAWGRSPQKDQGRVGGSKPPEFIPWRAQPARPGGLGGAAPKKIRGGWVGIKLAVALLAGRGAFWMSRRLGHGGGTVMPGHVVPRIDPAALHTIASRLSSGSVLVSGTNGKTTTARMVAQIASRAGLTPIHNRSGANLMSGIVAAMATHSDLSGRPQGDLGIFEVDEALVPTATRALEPRVLALTNIFRDQLDRYGEVELVVNTWRQAVASLSTEATLVLNADDPIVAQLGEDARCRVVYFGAGGHLDWFRPGPPRGGQTTLPSLRRSDPVHVVVLWTRGPLSMRELWVAAPRAGCSNHVGRETRRWGHRPRDRRGGDPAGGVAPACWALQRL